MAWMWALLALVSFGATIVCVHVVYVTWPMRGWIPKVLCGIIFVCGLALASLGLKAAQESYLRFTTSAVDEVVTVVSAKSTLVMMPIVHSTGKTCWVQQVPTWRTSVVTKEYPDQTFVAGGKHDDWVGTKVPITFYVRSGQKIRYDM